MSVVWNKDDFRIALCDENIEDANMTWDNSEPVEDGRYIVAADYGLSGDGEEKFCQAILDGDIDYPELKEYFEDLDAGDLEKWENDEIEETRRGYVIDGERLDYYKNEVEWKAFIKDMLEKGGGTGYCRVHFLIGLDGRFEITNIVRIETINDFMFSRYVVPQQFLDALLEAWLAEAGSEKTLGDYLKRGLPEKVRREMDTFEDNEVEEEEPVDMMSFIGQAISPSRYRGLTDRSRYELLDDRLAYIVDGVLICTDNECDIDCDGNICMVWPDGKVLHIGRVWMPESPEINKVKFSRSGNTLKQSCRVWYDNDHHHGGTEEEEIDLTPTPERRKCVEMNYLAADFAGTFRGVDRGSFYVESVKAYFRGNGDKAYLILEAKWVEKVPRSFNRHNHWEAVYINLTDGQFEDEYGEEITGGRFFKKLRCKLEEDSGKDARTVFCERFIPALQKFYPNVKAPLQEGLHPLYMRAMVIKDFLELTATDMVPSKSNELSNYFRDYVWINHYEVRYIRQYTRVAFDFTDAKIAEIFKHIK